MNIKLAVPIIFAYLIMIVVISNSDITHIKVKFGLSLLFGVYSVLILILLWLWEGDDGDAC